MLPTDLPDFVLGKHYRELHPTREGDKKWRYVLTQGIRLSVKGLSQKTVSFHDKDGNVWGRIDKFGIYLCVGYAWNGCSPKKWVWPFGWVGTVDFESTRLASLIHDILYQFAGVAHMPLTRSHVDKIFRRIIELNGSKKIARVYYGAVKRFGGRAWRRCLKRPNGEFSTSF